MTRRRYCESTTSPNCDGTLGASGQAPLSTCYRCGLDVCIPCSSLQRVPVLVGRGLSSRMAIRQVRMCDLCLEQEPKGEARVRLRRYHEAGYPERTLAQCEAEVAAQAAYPRHFSYART